MIIAPTPTETAFQQRRRRAAKLTHFFGVDYRDLMGEILDSIERGLEEESGKGTLKPDEVKVRCTSFLSATVYHAQPLTITPSPSSHTGSPTKVGELEDQAE